MPNGNSPARVGTTQQRIGSWVFGSLLLVFYMLVFLVGPAVLPDYKHQQLGILSALLGGLFTFFITGDILTRITWTPSAGVDLVVRATGGLGIAALVLLWWGRGGGPIDSSSRVAAQLRQQVDSTARTTTTDTAHRTGGVHTSASTRELAQALAQSDPKYRDVAPLANRVVTAEALSNAVATLQDPATGAPAANTALLQATFGSGIGPFKLGMTPSEVNAHLAQPFGPVVWSTLPVAPEYHTAEVRYFWVLLSQFSEEGEQATFKEPLKAFAPCWGGQSYVTFLFSEALLTRISIRLYPDCTKRVALLRQFAQTFGISPFADNQPDAFQVVLATTTIAGQISRDAVALDVFSNGSPQS